jgi:hypothetical protein
VVIFICKGDAINKTENRSRNLLNLFRKRFGRKNDVTLK